MAESASVTYDIGHTFHSLGLPEADSLKFRAELLMAIAELIAERDLGSPEIERLLDWDPADVSALANAQITNFTIERLIRALRNFGLDVEFRVAPAEAEKGVLRVVRDVVARR